MRESLFIAIFAQILIVMSWNPFAKKDKNPIHTSPNTKPKKSARQEWKETLIFGLVVVPLINIFILQSYAIPTSSMEGSMVVGDKLFVSKFHYGVNIPRTPLSLPFMHNRIWFTDKNSYTELIKLPYLRLPALEKVNSGDICVFNWPVGDTLTLEYKNGERSYMDLSIEEGYKMLSRQNPGRPLNIADSVMISGQKVPMMDLIKEVGKKEVKKKYHIITRPVDKKENYVKRCVAAAGDTLLVKEGDVYINGNPYNNNKEVQYSYTFQTDAGSPVSPKFFINNDVRESQINTEGNTKNYRVFLNNEEAEEIMAMPNVKNFTKELEKAGDFYPLCYPYNPLFPWNVDNYGPLYIPKKGDVIPMTAENYVLYERPIRSYENNPSLIWREGKAWLNGKTIDSYTFKMNYYYMIGDNRHNSQDSRMWGFVPEDHITGKPIFVWLSTRDSDYDGDRKPDFSWANPFSKINWKKCFRRLK